MACNYKGNFYPDLKKERLCGRCGARLDLQDRAVLPQKGKQEREKKSKVSKKESRLEQTYSGEFRQYGVRCVRCGTVTPFGKRKQKRCNTCNSKLIMNRKTLIYHNGFVEAIVCPRCKKHTNYKLQKCEHCSRKLKI